jgi:hypothetical protein
VLFGRLITHFHDLHFKPFRGGGPCNERMDHPAERRYLKGSILNYAIGLPIYRNDSEINKYTNITEG